MQINYSPIDVGDTLLNRAFDRIKQAFDRVGKLAGLPNGTAPLGPDGLIPPEFLGDLVTLSTLTVSAPSTFNATVTATLPAVPGKVHVITSIQILRVATAALAGGAILTYTSSNLPGNPNWSAGNLIAAGQSITDLDFQPAFPLRASAAGVATTITAPAAGANVATRINVTYFLVDP